MNRLLKPVVFTAILLTGILVLTCAFSIAAQKDRYCGDNLTWTLDSDGLLTITGTGDMYTYSEKSSPEWNHFEVRRVVISPGVTGIGSYAFRYCHRLKSIELPEGVTRLGDYAFDGCGALESISFPDSLREIGDNPFHNCRSMREVLLSPDQLYLSFRDGLLISKTDRRLVCRLAADETADCVIPAGIRIIGNNAFSSCAALDSVLIPEGVESVGRSAFYSCTGLTRLDLPDTVISIGNRAFSSCRNLKTVTLGNGLRSIGESAFAYCWNLTDLTLPMSLTELGSCPFFDCRCLSAVHISEDHPCFAFDHNILYSKAEQKLIFFAPGYPSDTYAVPEGIRIIGQKSFLGGRSLRKLILPESVVRIEQQAFHGCQKIEEIVFSQGLEVIESEAFCDLYALKEAVLPEGLVSIGDYAFGECTALESVRIPGSVTDLGREIFLNLDTINLAVYVTEGSAAEQYCLDHHLKAVLPGREVPEPETELPGAFAEQYAGYKALYRLEIPEENEAVYLVRTPENTLTLLCGTLREDTGWTVVESAPLPEGARVVLDYGLQLLDLGQVRCSVRRYYDDVWGIRFTGWQELYMGPSWIGYYAPSTRYFIRHPWGDLTVIDWTSLTDSLSDALKALDTSASATPDNPDREKTTPLYSAPEASGEPIAELFNGAPLFAAETNGEWTHVSLGRGDAGLWQLDGWVRTADLAFANSISRDRFAGPGCMLYVKSDVTLVTPLGSEPVTESDYHEDDRYVIGEKTIDGREYWLVYECFTEQLGFILKDDLYMPVG